MSPLCDIQTFAHALALQIARAPLFVRDEDITADVIARRENLPPQAKEKANGNIIPRIIEGAIKKFQDEKASCARRPSDESVTISRCSLDTDLSTGENVVIRRFVPLNWARVQSKINGSKTGQPTVGLFFITAE